MTTITLWLLVSVGVQWASGHPTQLIERFATPQDCQKTVDQIMASYPSKPRLVCIEARVLKEKP